MFDLSPKCCVFVCFDVFPLPLALRSTHIVRHGARDTSQVTMSTNMAQTTSSAYSFSSAPKAVGARKKYREPGPVDSGLYRSAPRPAFVFLATKILADFVVPLIVRHIPGGGPGEGDVHLLGQARSSREHVQYVHPECDQGGDGLCRLAMFTTTYHYVLWFPNDSLVE